MYFNAQESSSSVILLIKDYYECVLVTQVVFHLVKVDDSYEGA